MNLVNLNIQQDFILSELLLLPYITYCLCCVWEVLSCFLTFLIPSPNSPRQNIDVYIYALWLKIWNRCEKMVSRHGTRPWRWIQNTGIYFVDNCWLSNKWDIIWLEHPWQPCVSILHEKYKGILIAVFWQGYIVWLSQAVFLFLVPI